MAQVEDYKSSLMRANLWNAADDWVVQTGRHTRVQLFALLDQDVPLIRQLIELRRCFAPFRALSPREVRDRIGPQGTVDLGEMNGREAMQITQRLERSGLAFLKEDRSFISYLPVNKTRGLAWIIEDIQEAERISRDMISAGVPVEESLED